MPEQVAKLKKKQWFPILAPKQFDNTELGETLVYNPKEMIGKTLTHSLMNLKNDVKKQNVNINFEIFEVENNNAKTKIIGYEIIPSSVRRFVRRNSEKMDLSFTCETADKVFLRVKPLIVTKDNVKGSVASKLRNNAVQFLIKTINNMEYDGVINDLMSHKLQFALKDSLKKVYPLKICELRYVGIEAREKAPEVKAEEAGVKEKPKEAKKESHKVKAKENAQEAKAEAKEGQQ